MDGSPRASERITAILTKLQKSSALTQQEISELQAHLDVLEQRSLAAHGDTVQSSHFHPSAALEVGSGREARSR